MKFKILNSSLIELNTDSICIPYYKNNNKNTDLHSVNNLIDNLIDELDTKKQISSDIEFKPRYSNRSSSSFFI